MNEEPKSLEEQATEILVKDAKENHTTLYREGIIDARRRSVIDKREIPMSAMEKEVQDD